MFCVSLWWLCVSTTPIYILFPVQHSVASHILRVDLDNVILYAMLYTVSYFIRNFTATRKIKGEKVRITFENKQSLPFTQELLFHLRKSLQKNGGQKTFKSIRVKSKDLLIARKIKKITEIMAQLLLNQHIEHSEANIANVVALGQQAKLQHNQTVIAQYLDVTIKG